MIKSILPIFLLLSITSVSAFGVPNCTKNIEKNFVNQGEITVSNKAEMGSSEAITGSNTLQNTTETQAGYELSGLCLPVNPYLKAPKEVSPGVATTSLTSGGKATTTSQFVTVDSTTQTFSWSEVYDASSYSLYVRNLDTGVLEVNEENLTSPSYSTSTLKAGTHYKWNVRAKDGSNKGGWLSDGYYFQTKVGIVEAPITDTAVIEVYMIDDDDNLIKGNNGALAYYCPPELPRCNNEVALAGFFDDTLGKWIFKSSSLKGEPVYFKKNNSEEILRFNFTPNTTSTYLVNVNKLTGLTSTYERYNVNLDDEFTEGVLLEGGLTLGSVGITKGAIAVGKKVEASALFKKVSPLVVEYALKKGGKLLVAGTAAKVIPGIGVVVLVGVGTYALVQTADMITSCLTADQYMTFQDPDFKFYKTASFFCGRMAVRLSFVAISSAYTRPTATAVEDALVAKAESKMAANLEESAAKPVLDIITKTGASLSEAEQVVNEVTAIENLAAPEAKTLLNKAFANITCLSSLESATLNSEEVSTSNTNITLSTCKTLADIEILLTRLVAGREFGKLISKAIQDNDEAYLAKAASALNTDVATLKSLTHLEQLQVYLPKEGWVVLDDVWVKRIGQATSEIFANETKLSAATVLSPRQGQFLDALKSGVTSFVTRSAIDRITRTIKKGETVIIKSFVKTHGDQEVLVVTKLF